MLNAVIAMPAAQPAGAVTNEDMKAAETSHVHLPFSFSFGDYPRYSPFGYRSGLGIGLLKIAKNIKNSRTTCISNNTY